MNTRDKTREFIRQNFIKGDTEITYEDGTSFIEGGIIDSVGVLELVAFIEETYGFRVEDEELVPENLDSIDKLVAYIESKLAIAHS